MARKLKPYKYRLRPIRTPDANYGETILRPGRQEILTGAVDGMKASDLEERVYRALAKLEIPSQFRVRITSEALGMQRLTRQFANIRGEVEIDFLCDRGGLTYPIFVDGQIAHFFTPYQADADREKANIANDFGRAFGWHESIRLPFWQLLDQDMTDRTVRNIFV